MHCSLYRLKSDIKDFIRYRVYDRYNIIKIHSLKPGYWDADTRLLHGMFDLLVDFIEIEKAHMHKIFDDTGKYKWYKRLHGWVPFIKDRDPEAGLDYLDWEIEFAKDCPGQSESAQEQKILYLWWKKFPERKDPWQEWYDFHDSMWSKYALLVKDLSRFNMGKIMTGLELNEESRLLKRCQELESSNTQEEEDMLIRLIKVRECLWT